MLIQSRQIRALLNNHLILRTSVRDHLNDYVEIYKMSLEFAKHISDTDYINLMSTTLDSFSDDYYMYFKPKEWAPVLLKKSNENYTLEALAHFANKSTGHIDTGYYEDLIRNISDERGLNDKVENYIQLFRLHLEQIRYVKDHKVPDKRIEKSIEELTSVSVNEQEEE